MGLFDRFRKVEERNLENPNAPVSATDFLSIMGWGDFSADAGVTVNIDTALGVPSIFAAVNFLSGTLAGLPLNVYRKSGNKRTKVTNGVANILHGAVNDGMSSFEWRKYIFDQVFTGGRAVTYIERAANGQVSNLYPLDPTHVRVEFANGRKIYRAYNKTYEASEVIDIPFMLKANGLDLRGPIAQNKDVIGMAIAATKYGAKAFQSGGIPPAVLQGPFQSGAAAVRASDDVANTMAKLARDGRPVMALPLGHELKSVGLSPENMQLLELQRFCVEQIARIYSLPPVFLQDLSRGTFSNTEQQEIGRAHV